MPENACDVAIIGRGPAGLQAARDGTDEDLRQAIQTALEALAQCTVSGAQQAKDTLQAAATNATLSHLAARNDLFVAHAALDLAYGVHDR